MRSFATPGKKSHHPLSIEDLDDSDDNSEAGVLVDEISKLQKTVQQTKKEKRQLDLRIEGLEHDLMCAEKARQIGNNAAMNVAKRLAALFGEALKEEDLVPKVQQLQERVLKARQEVESLQTHLANLKMATPMAKKDHKKRLESINEEIAGAKMEEQKLINQISKIDKDIKERQDDLKQVQSEISALKARFNTAVGGDNWSVAEIREKIAKNSDEYLLDQCALAAQSMGIEFDPRSQISGFIDDLRQRIIDLRNEVTPTRSSEERFDAMAQSVQTAMAELKDVTSEVKKLERERNSLQMQLDTRPPVIVENYQPLLDEEKRVQEKRTAKLRQGLENALQMVGYDWEVPKSNHKVCAMYVKLIKDLQAETTALDNADDPAPDLSVLQSKVDSVRRQNRQLRKRIKYC